MMGLLFGIITELIFIITGIYLVLMSSGFLSPKNKTEEELAIYQKNLKKNKMLYSIIGFSLIAFGFYNIYAFL